MSTAGTVPVDSKSARKRKAKADTTTSGSGAATPSVEVTSIEAQATPNGVDSHGEIPLIKELQKY